MSSYRFCRSDDVPLLVQAYNACYRVHFAGLPEMRIEEFKLAIRQLDIWTSSCMVAMLDDAPIGVLLAAKRETQSLIHSVGVVAAYQRREHGRHLLASLSQKLGILGPPRMVSEIPAKWSSACAFMEACGYRREDRFIDFEHPGGGNGNSPASELLIPVSLDELVTNDAFECRGTRCWQRSPESLIARKSELAGLAVASDRRIEAFLLYHDRTDGVAREIMAFDCADADRREVWLELLFRRVCADADRPVRIARAGEGEISFGLLHSWGFRPGVETMLYAADAAAG